MMEHDCDDCGGTGVCPECRNDGFECYACSGTGRCPDCEGTGTVQLEEKDNEHN